MLALDVGDDETKQRLRWQRGGTENDAELYALIALIRAESAGRAQDTA